MAAERTLVILRAASPRDGARRCERAETLSGPVLRRGNPMW
jgi:hypothetical protein